MWWIRSPWVSVVYSGGFPKQGRQRRSIPGEILGEWCFISPATIAAIFDLVPNLFPLFTPGKGPAATDTGFLWELRFLNCFFAGLHGNGVEADIKAVSCGKLPGLA